MNSADEYNSKLHHYINNSQNNEQILEVQKCCGYSEFVFCYKECKLREVYDAIYYQFQISRHEQPIQLFIVNDSTKEKIVVPMSETRLKDFIRENHGFIKPIYPVPCKVVYRFHIDDGRCTKHSPDDFCYVHH
jgi:hypothetical protein